MNAEAGAEPQPSASEPEVESTHVAATPTDEGELLRALRDILLREDREQLGQMRQLLDDDQWFDSRVEPIIKEQLSFLESQFPDAYRRAVDDLISDRLASSQDELLEVIYPKLGTMINKYVQHQFQQLRESLEEQLHETFNQGVLGRIRYALGGVSKQKTSEAILSRLERARVEEVYVIERYSGSLLGNAARRATVDLDLVAGMLTAIKSFVEDAYQNGADELESIQYQNLTIILRSFPRYYVAVAVSGAPSSGERTALYEEIGALADKDLRFNLKKEDGSSSYRIQQVLLRRFFRPDDVRPSAQQST